MPRTRTACERPPQPAVASANTLSPRAEVARRPDEDDRCLATSSGFTDVEEPEPCDRPGLLPPDVEALATPRCRAHAELLRQHWLLLSLHWAACGSADGVHKGSAAATSDGADLWPFGHGSCSYGRGLWRHIRDCSGASCGNAMCLPTRQLTVHFCACRDAGCSLCQPVRKALALLSHSHPQQRASRRVRISQLTLSLLQYTAFEPSLIDAIATFGASAQRGQAQACPEVALLRQLCGALAAGEATLEEVAPTRYNLVRLVLDDMHKTAAAHAEDEGPPSPCMSAASSNTMCYT